MGIEMGIWQRLFDRRKRRAEKEDNWDKLEYSREGIDFDKEEDRTRYVTDCLEQIAEASKELELLKGEYVHVTEHLTDIEEIEALPESEREVMDIAAHKLLTLERELRDYVEREERLPDAVYYQMKHQEEEIEGGIQKLKEAENYQTLVKQDMQRLERERHAYTFRINELYGILANLKGMSVIFLTALVLCVLMLMVLQFGFSMDTRLGYLIAVAVVALAIIVLCIRYTDAERELNRVENANNRLIQLQNKVKIRYVNNTNLLDYLYMKYQVENVKTLEKQYQLYLQEKEERKQYAEAEARQEYYRKQLFTQLRRYRVKYPERIVDRVEVLVNKKEMVELRHELIQRRQALRAQMEYNEDAARNATQEIKNIVITYPKYAEEITEMVDKYDRRYT